MNANERYFDWLVDCIDNGDMNWMDNRKALLSYLFSIEFIPLMQKDEIRVEKIMELRDDNGGHDEAPDYPTVLELLVGLSISLEDNVMSNPEYGDRTHTWFWMMIENLGLSGMTNDKIDTEYVFKVIDRWMHRDFDRNGDGSPFPMRTLGVDMREIEIWRSLCLYVTENFRGRW